MDRETIIIKEALSRYSRYETDEICKRVQAVESMPDSLKVRLDKKISELLARVNKSFNLKKIITILIAATLIIACLSVVAYAVNERIKIGGFFIEWFDGDLKLNSDVRPEDNISLQNVNISYITEGFVQTKSDVNPHWEAYEWKNGDSEIYLSFSIYYSGNITLDNEGNDYTIVSVGDYTVHKIDYGDQIYVLWIDGAITYKVNCYNLLWEEVVKIIEGISYEEQ